MAAKAPRVVIGVPLYNHAHQLAETIESLLLQTYRDFAIVMSDDCSTDETAAIVRRYAERDPRIVYRKSGERLGYIRNARRCFRLARELFPDSEYFAWGSDHDLWHPRWMAAMVDALDRHPDAVVACPLHHRMDADGSILAIKPKAFSSVGIGDPVERFVRTFWGISAGNMIYGLMRSEAVMRAGNLPLHLLPDRLLLVQMALYGTSVHVPEYLWYRRYVGLASLERQIRASFLDGRPFYLRLPWWLAHAGSLVGSLALSRHGNIPVGRWAGLGLATRYVWMGIALEVHRWYRRTLHKRIQEARVRGIRRIKKGAAYIPADLRRAARRLLSASTGLVRPPHQTDQESRSRSMP